jgi:hypothetical protein
VARADLDGVDGRETLSWWSVRPDDDRMQQAELGHVGGQAGDVAQVAAVPFEENDLVDSPSRHRAGSCAAGTASPCDLGLRSARRRGGAAAGSGGLGLRLRGVASAKYARMSATR